MFDFVTLGLVGGLIALVLLSALAGIGVGLLISPLYSFLPGDLDEDEPGPMEAPMRAPAPRLSPSARLAWLLWALAIGGAVALLLAAGAAHAGPLDPPGEVSLALYILGRLMVWTVILSAGSLLLSVAAVMLAATRPRGGI